MLRCSLKTFLDDQVMRSTEGIYSLKLVNSRKISHILKGFAMTKLGPLNGRSVDDR